MKKKYFLILLSIIVCFVFNIINANAGCLNPNFGHCDENIVVQRSSGRNYIGSTYYYFTYARQLTHNNVYCIKHRATGPTSKICSLDNNLYGNATRAAIGYIIKKYDNDYGKAQYLIHRILELREGGASVEDYNLYQDEYETAARIAVNYENSVPDTYYLANLYNCGSGIQSIAEGYETIPINKVHIAYHPNGGTTTLPKNAYGWVIYNEEVYFHTIEHGKEDDPYNVSTLGITRTGYNFSGWMVYSTGTILDQNTKYHSTTYAHNNDKNKTTANTRDVYCYLYAQWEPDTYKIIYHGNGGYTSGGQNIVEDSINYNNNYTIRNGDLFSRTDHTFIGWTTNPNGETDDGYNWTNWSGNWTYTNGQYGIQNKELHLYARWQDSCVYDFKNTYNNNPSKIDRINLYKEYHRGAWNSESRRNLLNFTITDAETACGNYNPNYDINNACLTTDQVSYDTENRFTNENISDYNDELVSSSTQDKSYCLTDFELESNVDIKNNAKAGQMIYSAGENEEAITATLTKTCYIPTGEINNYNFVINGNNYYSNDYIKNNFKVLKSYKNGKNFYYKNNPGFVREKKGILVEKYNRIFELTNTNYILNKTNCPNSRKFKTLDGNDICLMNTPNMKICDSCNSSNTDILYNYDNRYGFNNFYIVNTNQFMRQYTQIDDIYVKNSDKIINSIINITSNDYLNYDDYITKVLLENKELRLKEPIGTPVITMEGQGDLKKITGVITANYVLNPKYVYKLSGKTEDPAILDCYDEANDRLNPECTIAGYGVISKFKDGDNTGVTNRSLFNFKIDNSTANKHIFDFTYDYNNECPYTVSPEIIKYDNNSNGNLELEFRSIDKNKPFGRLTNANWCGEGDNPCNSNNTTVQRVIKERNDSYNRTGAGALYTNQTDGTRKIVLTPDKIQQIKDYNRRVGSYNDYTNYTNIVDGEEKTSTAFLDELEITKVP